MSLTDQQLALLKAWNEAKGQLKVITIEESSLREQLVQELFNANTVEGTETIDVPNNWKLKATKKLNYSLDNGDGKVAVICAQLPDVVARSIVRWKPDLILAAWRKLDAHTQGLFTDVLEIKAAKPTLELIPPKE